MSQMNMLDIFSSVAQLFESGVEPLQVADKQHAAQLNHHNPIGRKWVVNEPFYVIRYVFNSAEHEIAVPVDLALKVLAATGQPITETQH
jgi:hypothetical protein